MSEVIISKPIHKILAHLTGEQRLEVALPLATKELIQLKLNAYNEQIKQLESKYNMTFDQFKKAWENDQLQDKYDYEIEKDYWAWEAALTEQRYLTEALEELQ